MSNMTAKEASKIVLSQSPGKVILEGYEFPDFYGFALIDKDKVGEKVGGGLHTVDKRSGAVGGFSPTSDLDGFFAAKIIDLKELEE